VWASTTCYGDSFTILYVDEVRTSQETHVWASTTCYGDSFTVLYVDEVRCYLHAANMTCNLVCLAIGIRQGPCR
jgi:hypothetical protein